MTATHTVGRKQMVVICMSVLLAIGSYFIPLRDPTSFASPQAEQTLKPTLPAKPLAPKWPVPGYSADTILLAGQPADMAGSEAQATTRTGIVPSTDPPPAATAAPASKLNPIAAATPNNQAAPVAETLSAKDFYSSAPDSKFLPILPINQSDQF